MPCFAKETRKTLTRKEEDLWKKKKTSHASVSVTLFHADQPLRDRGIPPRGARDRGIPPRGAQP